MNPREQDDFLDALANDDALFDEFEEMRAGQKTLGSIDLEPSENSVNKVLHIAGSASRRRLQAGKAPIGKNPVLSNHHLVSVGMVLFTCMMVAIALFAYKLSTTPQNNWANSKDALKFENNALDDRLEFARERLGNIIDNQSSAPLPVHHDTYRLVSTDLSKDVQPGVVLLNIK